MTSIKRIGLVIFLTALGLFLMILLPTRYDIDTSSLQRIEQLMQNSLGAKPFSGPLIEELSKLKAEDLGGKFSFIPRLNRIIDATNEQIAQDNGVSESLFKQYMAKVMVEDGGSFTMTQASREQANALLPESMRQIVSDYTGWLIDRPYDSESAFQEQAGQGVQNAINGYLRNLQVQDGDMLDVKFSIVKGAAHGLFWNHKYAFFFLIIVMGTIGGLIYVYPAFFDGHPGIKHNGIYHKSATSRGLIGILIGAFLIGFYIMLYFVPYAITEWIVLFDPIAKWLRGEGAAADRWFMYGTLYTLSVIVMGIRMFGKYRHSRYHQVRTASIMFFQTGFAFLIPELLAKLNAPALDMKNAWPLNYSFFFDYNIQNHLSSGNLGIWMIGWGIALTLIGVPLFTYFYGKRWYCSWVCGCGGLAETLGDPYRQLSDKSLNAWKIERWLIHSVLVFAVVMTALALYTVFTKSSTVLGLNSYTVRSWYGFGIGAIFAGVVGTGFYPLMGNRVWCRFGCPLAAYLGLVQRFKSRFRITTNGGQCISCGNCSTYCEMGIDVRAYAQRGQNIVRSSCVGCGVCAAVCPRGVLSLENLDNTDGSRMDEVRY
ncbi:MAG: 4Fe-4S dicluster domain-containing protein [Bacteroidota bacterium]